MKVEIDLNDILGDENGVETLRDSVKRQVIDSLKIDIQKKIKTAVDEEIALVIRDQVKSVCDKELPILLTSLMDTPYIPVGKYGEREKETTIRKVLLTTLENQMQYMKKDQWNNRDDNFW